MSKPCKLHLRGRCMYGDRCKFSHTAAIEQRRTAQSSEASTSSQQRRNSQSSSSQSRPRFNRRACYAWRDGDCPRGDKCFYAHDPQVREERLRRERAEADHRQREEQRQAELAQREAAVQAEVARQQTSRQALLARQQAERARREAAELAQKEAERCAEIVRRAEHAQRSRQEASQTIQRIVLKTSLVTYAAGIAIRNVVTGFESCRIRIKGLPADAHEKEILELFTQQGIDADRLFLVDQKRDEGRLEATVVTTAEEGSAIAIGLEGIEFREEHLGFEICDNATGTGISSSEECETVTLTWRAPSNTVVATFASHALARAKVSSLNQYIWAGRRIKAELHGVFDDRAVRISGLPLIISHRTLADFVGCEVSQLRFLATIAYDVTNSFQQVENEIRSVLPRDLQSVTASSPAEGDMDGKVTIKARCRSREAAKRVQRLFNQKKLAYLGDQFIRAHLPHSHEAVLSIPSNQYRAQRRLWNALAGSDTPKSATIRISPPNDDQVQIRVWGDDKHAVGSLKVRVENIADGEALPRDLWHRSFAAVVSPFINSIFDATGVYAHADWKLCVVKLYSGDPIAVEHARQMVREEVERLNASEWTLLLKRQSIRFFVQGGMRTLRETLGEGNVSLAISGRTAKLSVRGGEDARQVVDRLVAESLENVQPRTADGTTCPICHDEVTHPVLLGCNHSYCLNCLRHYMTTAADTFPLNCLGNEATCNVPIALPVIERFLSPAQFQELLEAAYRRYIEQHPAEFKYCKTADCTQVYRRQTTHPLARPSPVTCPSCFFKVCPACDEEGHEGMSCDDRRLQNDPGEQERRNDAWAAENGIKRCPACSIWIEKTEGCNHMTCKCGAHICWICVRQFPQAAIYDHLRAAHGGPFDVPAELAQPPVRQVHGRAADGRLDFPGLFGHFPPAPGYQERAQQRARQARDDARRRVVVVEPADPDIEPVPAWINEYQAHFEAERRDAVDALRRQVAAEQLRLDQERLLAEAEAEVAEQRRLRLVEDARRHEEGGWCIVM